jgi:hypothetical protein
MSRPLPALGVGLAFQAPLTSLFDADAGVVDYAEVVPDMFWTDRGPDAAPRYIEDEDGLARMGALHARMPLVPHSIGLSIGSAAQFDRDHIAQVAGWRRLLDFPWHSDHLAFHLAEEHGRRVNAGITLPLARDRESLDLLVPRVREVMPCIGSMNPGRNIYTALKGNAATAFSALPFTRAHMTLPRSLLSALCPETKTQIISGLSRASGLAADRVNPTVIRS